MAVYRCNMGIKNSQATEDGLKARALWIAVLMRAIKDFCGLDSSGGPRINRHELARWFASDSKEECSFRWICSACRVPATKIRQALADGSARDMLAKTKTG